MLWLRTPPAETHAAQKTDAGTKGTIRTPPAETHAAKKTTSVAGL